MATVGSKAFITAVSITNVTTPTTYQSVVFTSTNDFTIGDTISVTGITPSTLNVPTAEIIERTSTTFTLWLTPGALSGSYSSGGVATVLPSIKYSITESPLQPIGKPPAVTALYQNKDNVFDVAVGGEPFFLAASDKYPYHRETASYKRQQLDLTQAPGEQTFEGWWLRSQSSWHLGAGINYLEPLQGEDVIYRFNKSNGVDVWTPGKLSLLNDVDPKFSLSDKINLMGTIDGNGISNLFVSDDSTLTRIGPTGPTGPIVNTTVNYGGTGSDISSLTQDGTNYYAANSTGIYTGLLTGSGTGSKIWNTGSNKVTMNWVKQRLFAGIGRSLYELAGGSTPSSPAPVLPSVTYQHPNPNWTWTSITEGPTAIYASGYAGTSSAIYKLTITETGSGAGGVPTLAQAVTAADFPDEEHVTSIGTYLGKYMMIGTNKGIRVGVIDTAGNIAYGGLTYAQNNNNHVTGFAFRDRFAYATVTNDIDGKSGLIRIDLSAPNSDGLYPWANDLSAGVSGDCRGVAYMGETGRLAFTVAGSSVYLENLDRKVASGYLDTGAMRFNTMEKKHFKLVKLRVGAPLNGPVGLATIQKDGTLTSVITITSDSMADQDFTTNITTPQEQLALRFTLYRNSDDNSLGAELVGYQAKALPAIRRTRSISIPLMCYDFEQDRYNIITGYEGRAWNRLSGLETIEANGDIITIQDFTTGEQVEGWIEKVAFDRVSAADRRFQGFGGIIYVQVRTV